jgi:hypothetical protein
MPLVRRSRAALSAATAAALALLAWGIAPYTGLDAYGAVGAIANTRYLLPAIAACTLALAVSARGAGRAARAAVVACLLASIGYSVVRTAAFGPLRPALATLAVAAGAGALAAALARAVPVERRLGAAALARAVPVERRLGAAALGVAAVAGLAVGARGYLGRYLAADNPPDRALYGVPALTRDGAPIASSPGVFVLLRGERLEHPLALIGDGESCAAVRARLARGPIVLGRAGAAHARLAGCLAGTAPVARDAYTEVYARQ